MRNFYAFIHIPKTAGMTFYEILKRNFRNGYLQPSHGLYESPIKSKNIQLYIQEDLSRKAIAGHRVSLGLPFKSVPETKIIAITFIRNPVVRLKSEFHYVKKLKKIHKGIFNAKTYCDFLKDLINNEALLHKVSSYQFDFLTTNTNYKNINSLKSISAENLFMFPVERFFESVASLEVLFPRDFKDCSFVIKNRNLKKENDNSNYVNDLESQILQYFKSHEKNDYKLWELANLQLDNIIKNNFHLFIKRTRKLKVKNIVRSIMIDPTSGIIDRASRFISSIKL